MTGIFQWRKVEGSVTAQQIERAKKGQLALAYLVRSRWLAHHEQPIVIDLRALRSEVRLFLTLLPLLPALVQAVHEA